VGVSRNVIEHRLQVSPRERPKKQKLCKMSEEKVDAAKAEVQGLLNAGFIKDLNKCCLKDDFPLAQIDKIVDSTAGCEMMALVDCFSGYHQIRLHKEDKEKTSFATPFGTFCYLIMLEGLHNGGPILQNDEGSPKGSSQ
jgi:hypothetical protein